MIDESTKIVMDYQAKKIEQLKSQVLFWRVSAIIWAVANFVLYCVKD